MIAPTSATSIRVCLGCTLSVTLDILRVPIIQVHSAQSIIDGSPTFMYSGCTYLVLVFVSDANNLQCLQVWPTGSVSLDPH